MYLISSNFNKFIIFSLLVTFTFIHNSNANLREKASDSHAVFLSNEVLENLKNKKYKKVAQILKRGKDLNEQEKFLMGFILFKMNKCKDAVHYLNLLNKKQNLLKSYGMFFLGKCFKKMKKNTYTIKIYQKIIDEHPDSIFISQIYSDLISLLIKEKKYGLAIKVINNFQKSKNSSKFLSYKAICHEKRNENKKAIKIWRKIWLFFPHKFEAKKAYKILKQKKSFRTKPFTQQQLFQRAKTLRHKYFFGESLKQLNEILVNFPKTKLLKKIKYLKAFNLYSLRRTNEARLSFEKIINSVKISDLHKSKIRFYLSRNYLREKNREAFEYESGLILTETPKSPWAKKSLYLLARVHQDVFEDKKAKFFYKKLILKFPESKFHERAKWQLAWLSFRAEKYLEALKGFQEVIKTSQKRELVSSAFFWAGFTAKESNQPRLAIKIFQRCINRYRRNYYGHLCSDHLLKLQQKTNSRILDLGSIHKNHKNSWFKRPKELSKKKSFQIARILSSVGLHKFAAEEYKRSGTDRFFKFQAAKSYYLSDEKSKALRIIFSFFNKILYSGGKDIPKEFWKIAYPIEKIKNKPKNTDIYLLHSIIKAESLFDRNAISPAGAIGMMQLMPKTARSVSKKHGIKFKSKFDLFNSSMNKKIGAYHMQDLLKTFNGEIVPVIASYNAGRSAASKWWRNKKDQSIEVFVEQIPYRETRKYVKKVLGYYREYKKIYLKKKRP